MDKEQQEAEAKKRTDVKTMIDYVHGSDYLEIPESVKNFVSKPEFLGSSLGNGSLLFPIWHDVLTDVFKDDSYTHIVFTGAIGTGKSTAAIVGIAYVLHQLLCMKNPWEYYNLAKASKMGVSFFNLTKNLGDSRGFAKLQSLLVNSPWFREKASYLSEQAHSEKIEFDLFRWLLASPYAKGGGTLGEDVICGIMDEVDSPTESVGQKERVLQAYKTTSRRFETRFVVKEQSLGRLFLVASKQDEASFLEKFVAEMKDFSKVKVFDIKYWDSRPKSYYSGITFPVAHGDAFHQPKVLTEEEVGKAVAEGYSIVQVPIEHKPEFELDVRGALRDIAGISVAGSRKRKLFSSDVFIAKCFDDTKYDPMVKETIEIGLKDEERLMWYVDLAKIRLSKRIPRGIHFDYGLTGDAASIAMSGICGYKDVQRQRPDGTMVIQKEPIVETDFVMRLKAKEGDEIPQHKIREFILELKMSGFNIFKFTSDLRIASADALQLLIKAGVPAEYMSVDKTDEHYLSFRDLVYDSRWVMHPHKRLLLELSNLERDEKKRKVDHPDKIMDIVWGTDGSSTEVVMEGSKDISDAVCGSIINALLTRGQAMDFDTMGKAMEKVKEASKAKKEDNPIDFPFETADGKKIVGISQGTGGNFSKMSEILRKMHER